jgi:hypothetical protein
MNSIDLVSPAAPLDTAYPPSQPGAAMHEAAAKPLPSNQELLSLFQTLASMLGMPQSGESEDSASPEMALIGQLLDQLGDQDSQEQDPQEQEEDSLQG